jgi:Uma2 family endonuclease
VSSETFAPLQDRPPGYIGWRISKDFILSSQEIPNIEELVIEDGQPVDNIFVEKQNRLLIEPLYSSWTPTSGPFLALANVGLFYQAGQPALMPDMMLSLNVPASRDLSFKENRSYLTWIIGKPPDLVIEIASDHRGDEEVEKMNAYARIAVIYYVLFDPQKCLYGGSLRAFSKRDGKYQPIEPSWLPSVGLGLTFWKGEFEGQQERWLRWCDRDGVVIPTGHERAEQEKQRAERLAAQLRAHGIEPGA